MIYRVIITNMLTGETFKATRRFPTREAADVWAAIHVLQFEGRREWKVEAETLPGSGDW